jgi:dGTPase
MLDRGPKRLKIIINNYFLIGLFVLMNWKELLDTSLLLGGERTETEDRPHYAQDYDRVIFSAPFRRLASKTQVHPMYADDHLHHRLIHSIETSSVGRSLGLGVGSWLEKEKHIEGGEKHKIAGILQAACAAHDIGNPPFGHSGETAIGEWFSKKFENPDGLFADIPEGQRAEFEEFEGNAQGFRLLTRTEMNRNEGGMRMTYATLGAFTKYPVIASTKRSEKRAFEDKDAPLYKGLKKFGIFSSELELFEKVAEKTGLLKVEAAGGGSYWKRHPLVFLVEAADDICYNIMDLEDAYIVGDLTYNEVVELLQALSEKLNLAPSSQTAERKRTESEEVSMLRAVGIGRAVQACTAAFIDNYASIMNGTFSESLTSSSSLAK